MHWKLGRVWEEAMSECKMWMQVKLIWVTIRSESKPDLKTSLMSSGGYVSKYSCPTEQSIWNGSDFLSWLFIMKTIFISNHLSSGTLCSYRSTDRRLFLCIYRLRKNKWTCVFPLGQMLKGVSSFSNMSLFRHCWWMLCFGVDVAPVVHADLFLGRTKWFRTFRRFWGLFLPTFS